MKNNMFGKNLRQLRTDESYSQEQLAAILKVEKTRISDWERGVSEPGYDMLVEIAKTFDVTIDTILTDELSIKKS